MCWGQGIFPWCPSSGCGIDCQDSRIPAQALRSKRDEGLFYGRCAGFVDCICVLMSVVCFRVLAAMLIRAAMDVTTTCNVWGGRLRQGRFSLLPTSMTRHLMLFYQHQLLLVRPSNSSKWTFLQLEIRRMQNQSRLLALGERIVCVLNLKKPCLLGPGEGSEAGVPMLSCRSVTPRGVRVLPSKLFTANSASKTFFL